MSIFSLYLEWTREESVLEGIVESLSCRKLKPAEEEVEGGGSTDRGKYSCGSFYKVKIDVRSEREKRTGLGDPVNMKREWHLQGLSFRFIEVARAFISVRNR